jgi:hypothetical protein
MTLQARSGVATRSATARVVAVRVVASLRRCNSADAMAGRADKLFCNDGTPGGAGDDAEIFIFFIRQLQWPLLRAREKENDKVLYAQKRKRTTKSSTRKRERERTREF